MLVKTFCAALYGIEAFLVSIEVNSGKGTKTIIVGLPDNAVRESILRIRTALQNCKLKLPRVGILVNMAPADLKKEGAYYDLAIATGMLCAVGTTPALFLDSTMLIGELSLDGTIKPIKGALVIALEAKKRGFIRLILPAANAIEAGVVEGLDVIPVKSIVEVHDYFSGELDISPMRVSIAKLAEEKVSINHLDFSDVKGQESIKRCMEIAAAGGHNVILIGPPGSGKTMLARRISGILPPLDLEESLETTKIHSVAGTLQKDEGIVIERPFRNPHHTISDVALVGGGTTPQPGEISLAHNGVLFLDELPEFKRSVLEVLRQPIEERRITVSRSRFTVDYPAYFILVASMNPCPCGYYNHPTKKCTCHPQAIERYLSKVSGPLLDRVDIHVEVSPVEFDELNTEENSENSTTIRARVKAARIIQKNRFLIDSMRHTNAQMNSKEIRLNCQITKESQLLLKTAMNNLQLSARAYDRILKVARTIADLANSKNIQAVHLAEAIQYRSLDRENWGT